MADSDKDKGGSTRAFTPFGVLEDEAGALKAFDDESFFDEVLLPAEKEQYKKNKKDYLENPDAKGTVQNIGSGIRFIPWKKSVIGSVGRFVLAAQMIASNTWALSKEAIPDFIGLIEKLEKKFFNVVGDDDVQDGLEKAKRRAQELLNESESGDGSSVSSSVGVTSHGRPGMCTGSYPISRGILLDTDGNKIDPSEMYFEESDGSFSKVEASGGGKKKGGDFLSVLFSNNTFSDSTLFEADTQLAPDDVRLAWRDEREGRRAGAISDRYKSYLVGEVRRLLSPYGDLPTRFARNQSAGGAAYRIAVGVSGLNSSEIGSIIQGWKSLGDGFYVSGARDRVAGAGARELSLYAPSESRWDRGNRDDSPMLFNSRNGGDVMGKVRVNSGYTPEQEQAINNYVQELVSRGIPEEKARQLADNFFQSVARSAQGLADSLAGSQGVSQARRAIRSEGDVIVHQDPDEKDKGEEDGDSEDDFALGDGEEEGSLDFGDAGNAQDVDAGFMDEVNDIEEFGADEPALGKEEVVDALQAIGQIIDTVLQAEGVDKEEGLTSDEEGFVLDQVDDLAAGFADDEGIGGESGVDTEDSLEPEELEPEELGASFVRVVVAGKPVQSRRLTPSYISTENYGGVPAVVCMGINSSLNLVPEEEVKDSVVDTVILSSVQEIKGGIDFKSGYISLADILSWRKQSPEHGRAWRVASSHVTRRLGHTPKLAREIGVVGCVASSIYNKWYGECKKYVGKLEKVLSGKKLRNIHRVVSALRGRLAEDKSLRVIKSDYNGYKNYETWNVAIFLQNNEGFRAQAKAFLKSNHGVSYDQLIRGLGLAGKKTPDRVDWLDQRIDRREMAKVLAYLSSAYRGNTMVRNVSSATQVDGGDEINTVQGDTPTRTSTSGRTFTSEEIEGENSIKAVGVSGGDTSEFKDVDNTGDEGSLEADVDAGTEFNDSGYSFDSGKIAALQLPIEDDNDSSQVLELREIGSGVYVLSRAFTVPGGGRCFFVKGKDAVKVLSQNVKPSGIRASVDRVLTLRDSKNGLLVKSSAVLGVIAVEAPFTKGLRNAKYSVFSRTGVNLVNDEGFYIPSVNGPPRVIASAVSSKAVRKGVEKRNIFSEIESSYIQYLKSCLLNMGNDNAKLKVRLNSALSALEQHKRLHSSVLERERSSSRKQVASSLADLQAIRISSARDEAGRAFAGSQSAARKEREAIKSQADRNIDYLARFM
jgi:hypothetical protein